jgi:hypothetical protein
MFAAILITLIIIAALGYSMQTGQDGGLIGQHRYNNRHNDAAGARDDHLG